MKIRTVSLSLAIALSSVGILGCDEHGHDHAPAASSAGASAAADHPHGPNGEHAPTTAPTAGHGGPVIALGTAIAGSFTLVATRDQGDIVAGKDAPIDVTVTSTNAKAGAVRFWIGTEDAKGSVKAKAEVENPAEPNRWHTHAEIPDPLPAGVKLWVEVEADGAAKSVASFDLKS
jgi:hypothetical protein